MKYMNQSGKFGRARFRIPMNLQFFAEGGEETAPEGPGGGETAEDGTDSNDEKPEKSYEQLVTELAQERLEKEKYKNLNDKSSREAADYKKQLRAKMSAEEQAAIAKKEAEDAKDARIAELEAREKIRDYTELLMDKEIGMEKKGAKDLAQTLVDGDFDKALSMLGKHIKSIKDNAYQQALKDRPEPAAGNGVVKNDLADRLATDSAKRMGGANENIINRYRRG